MKYKQFIRFVVNDNGKGKIKAMNKIVKVYDDENNFIKIEQPFIYAIGTQINVDMAETDSSKFMPLRHSKHVAGKIVKKSSAEIQQIEEAYRQAKQARLLEIQQKEQEITTAKNIVLDENKTIEERIGAVADLIRKGKI